jgi:hypothetical protein
VIFPAFDPASVTSALADVLLVRESLDGIYLAGSGRILAMLIRLLGDFDLAADTLLS